MGSSQHQVLLWFACLQLKFNRNVIRYSRLLSPRYGDGYSSPTISITGHDLPIARMVSLVAFGEGDVADPQFTLVNMQWGQIMTHDMSMLAGSTQSSNFTSLFVPDHLECDMICVFQKNTERVVVPMTANWSQRTRTRHASRCSFPKMILCIRRRMYSVWILCERWPIKIPIAPTHSPSIQLNNWPLSHLIWICHWFTAIRSNKINRFEHSTAAEC